MDITKPLGHWEMFYCDYKPCACLVNTRNPGLETGRFVSHVKSREH